MTFFSIFCFQNWQLIAHQTSNQPLIDSFFQTVYSSITPSDLNDQSKNTVTLDHKLAGTKQHVTLWAATTCRMKPPDASCIMCYSSICPEESIHDVFVMVSPISLPPVHSKVPTRQNHLKDFHVAFSSSVFFSPPLCLCCRMNKMLRADGLLALMVSPFYLHLMSYLNFMTNALPLSSSWEWENSGQTSW